MNRVYHSLPVLVLVIVFYLPASPQATAAQKTAAPQTAAPSGTVSMVVNSLALGVGAEWGNGILTLRNGTQHRFTVKGLEIGSVGVEKAFLHGRVYYLTKKENFTGLYGTVDVGMTVMGGSGGVAMRNKAGVVLYLDSVEQGVAVNFGAAGVEITLKN